MEGIIKEALIKVVTGNGPDRVMIVENLPKRLIYQRSPKMVPVMKEGYATEAEMVVPGEFVDQLRDGIEMSQTGDGGFVFNMNLNEAALRLKELDQYVERNTARDEKLVQRVSYAEDPSDPRSPVISRDRIPRAQLPALVSATNAPLRAAQEPVSPPAQAAQVSTSAHTLSDEEWREYQEMKLKKTAAQERMAKARASK